MSYYDGNWFKGSRVLFQECIDNETPWDFYVMCVILHRVRHNGNKPDLELGECFIGLRELGSLVGKHHTTIEKSLQRLEKKGVIRRTPERHIGTKIKVLYASAYLKDVYKGQTQDEQLLGFNKAKHSIAIEQEHISQVSGNETPKTELHTISPETSKVLDHLNKKMGRRFDASGKAGRLVGALFKKGHTAKDLIMVVDHKAKEWDNDKMRQHLVPKTLFGPKNFEDYIEEARSIIPLEEKYSELFPFGIGGDDE
jgi:uncharacterized phage protein (TIGR02220 family)